MWCRAIRGAVLQCSTSWVGIRSCSMNTEKFRLPKRYEGHHENVWVEYAQLAAQCKPLNLGQGFPDFVPPAVVSQALAEVAVDPNALLQQYTRPFVSKIFNKS